MTIANTSFLHKPVLRPRAWDLPFQTFKIVFVYY